MSHVRRNTVSNIFDVTVAGLVAGKCCSVTDLDHLLQSPAIAEDCYILVVLFFLLQSPAYRFSDSERLLYFGRVIFFIFIFFSVHQIFDIPGPIFAKLYHTTRYVLK